VSQTDSCTLNIEIINLGETNEMSAAQLPKRKSNRVRLYIALQHFIPTIHHLLTQILIDKSLKNGFIIEILINKNVGIYLGDSRGAQVRMFP